MGHYIKEQKQLNKAEILTRKKINELEEEIKHNCKRLQYNYRIYDRYCYINTDIGLWRICISLKGINTDSIMLHHHNHITYPINLYGYKGYMNPMNYHKQRDRLFFNYIKEIFDYIEKHDKSKRLEKQDINSMPTRTKKQRQWKNDAIYRRNKRATKNVYRIIEGWESERRKQEMS